MDDEIFDDAEPAYMFNSLSDLVNFVTWLMENFENPEDFEAIIANVTESDFEDMDEEAMNLEDLLDRLFLGDSCTRKKTTDDGYLKCDDCGAIFATPSGLTIHQAVLHADKEVEAEDTEFWSIIDNSYKNHHEETNGDLQHPD